MKILLVYPTQLDDENQPIKYRKAYMPPLSLAILAGLTPQRHELHVVNDMVESVDFEGSYDLVAITALTSSAPRAYQIADRFRTRGVKVAIGGIHASFLPDEASQHADAVVIGEAEELWEEMLDDAEAGRLRSRYICCCHPSLEKLIVPRWDSFNLEIYRKSAGGKCRPRLPIFTTRGCLYACKYCTVTKFFGQTHRHKPIANVLAEIESAPADAYFFVDDNIACNFDYAEELFKALKGKGLRWLSQASTQILDRPDLIDLAAEAGCKNLFIGIESINPNVLRSVRKGFNNPDFYPELFARLERAGIRPLAAMIIGLDQDTPENVETTLDYLFKHRVQNIYLSIYTPLPASDLYTEIEAAGRILDRNWSKYDASHVVFQPTHFTPEELQATYWKMYNRLYSPMAIASRFFREAASFRVGAAKLMRDLAVQLHMHRQVRHHINPLSMGIGRWN